MTLEDVTFENNFQLVEPSIVNESSGSETQESALAYFFSHDTYESYDFALS